MATMRFNHMELTLAPGTLDEEARRDISDFYGSIFGWGASTVQILGQDALLLSVDPTVSQFILLTEQKEHMASPGYDHLGLLVDDRAAVDSLLDRCRRAAERDPRVRIKEYDDLDQGVVVVHAFYVKYILPIWFDVQCMDWQEGARPAQQWRFG